MKTLTKIALTTIIILGISYTSQSQTTISPEKEKLIAELIKVTKTEEQIDQIVDEMLVAMEESYPIIISQLLEKEDRLSDQEKADLAKMMLNSFKSFNKKFRQRLPETINYKQFVKDSMYPIYDKFYTAKEITDMITFYKTETGQKVINTMPQLFNETNKLTEKNILPKITKLLDDILKEESREIEETFSKEVGN